jgi:hypothetical protein
MNVSIELMQKIECADDLSGAVKVTPAKLDKPS